MDRNTGWYWHPFRHVCGCYLDWGIEITDALSTTLTKAADDLTHFFRIAAPFPCPLCGSATGIPADTLGPDEVRYMPANRVWYQTCGEERKVFADRMADHLS